MLEYLHILYHYQYFNRNPVQILTASPDGWERSWSLLFRLPELFGVSELSKSSSTIRKDKVQKSLKRSRQFTLNWKCKLQQFDWCQWLPMSEFPESPWHFIGCTSTGDRIICPTSCQHPSHRNSVGSRYEKTLFINSWSIHQENHPICLSTKPQIIEIPGNSQQILLNSWTNLHQKIPWASVAVSRCTKARACVSCGAKESKVKAQKSPQMEIRFLFFRTQFP